MSRLASRAFLSAILFASALWPGRAHADTREECAAASEDGQRARQAGKLTEARERFISCARSACPAVVKRDCDGWLTEVEAGLPSIIVDARDSSGRDLAAVRVLVDGVAVAQRLDGRALYVDPGPHAMRYEHEGESVEVDVVIHEGEKMRTLPVRFGGEKEPARRANDGAATIELRPAATSTEPRTSAGVVVFGGLAAVSLLGFTALAIAGQSRFDACADSRACSDSEKSTLRLERGVAFGALAVGLLSLGAATWFALSRRAPAPAR